MPRRRPGERRNPPPEDPQLARDQRRQRAHDEALDVQERFDRPFRSFEVRNPVHGTRYRVLGPETPAVLLCPCPDFGRRDVGTCKHAEAVLAYLTAHPAVSGAPAPTPTEAIWTGIEVAVGRYAGSTLRTLRPLWDAGRLLTHSPGP